MTSDIHHYDNGRPLNHSESIKRQLERDAAKHFLHLYEQMYKTPMRNIWHNEPAKPDISCHLNGEPLDLEIAHLYANKSEAKEVSARDVTQSLSDLGEMDCQESLSTALGRLLHSKAQKQYDSQRVWLVIRNASPLWKAKNFKRCIRNFQMPNNPFEQIWLLPEFDGSELPIQIFRS